MKKVCDGERSRKLQETTEQTELQKKSRCNSLPSVVIDLGSHDQTPVLLKAIDPSPVRTRNGAPPPFSFPRT